MVQGQQLTFEFEKRMNRQNIHINQYQIRHNHFWQVTNKAIIVHMKAVLVQYKSNCSK